MPETTQELYTSYCDLLQKAADINNASAVLNWDQETYMPPKGADARGRQLSTLAGMAHEILTSDKLEQLLLELSKREDLDDIGKNNVRLSLQDFEKNKKLPADFVEELTKQTSECFNAWIDARNKNDFSIFAPSLTKMVGLVRKQTDLYGYDAHPYDALLDDYEKGITVALLDPVFAGIREQFPPILAKIKAAPQVDDSFFDRNFPKQQQWDFAIEVMKQMGFDFEAGRQDYSEHPFTTSFAPSDVRVTTRVDENNYSSMLWSCIHECGHGLYEQGLPEDQYGLPLGSPTSLGIHESQSRTWENCIGRGHDFWMFFYPKLQARFPEQLADVTVDAFFKAANKVEPSLVRTEADELTYHFHVLIRYDIEKQLIEGTLDVNDLKAKWNELYQQYLGITPPDDKSGVLQDVHWSHGSFGYFPTYTLGSFYSAQFYTQALQDIPDLLRKIAAGELKELLQWLREKVHKHGRRFTSEELCEQITGQKLDPSFFIRYVVAKYETIYGIG